jgi:hypothetical protein
MSAVIKTCSCGATYTRDQWRGLRGGGIQRVAEDDALELRDCRRCSSTIAIELERWRPVPGYDGYEVSDLGALRSWRVPGHPAARLRVPRELTGFKNWAGYRLYPLYHGVRRGGRQPKAERQQIHRLVLMAFVGLPPERHVAAHLNGDNSDNRLSNLAWVTRTENESHKKIHGTAQEGERHHAAKLTDAQATAIRRRRESGETLTSIAADYGVSISTVSLIGRGHTWRTVQPVAP